MLRSTFLAALLLVLALPAHAADPPDLTPPAPTAPAAAWEAFSLNLVEALRSDNLGLKCSALQQIAAYGPKVDVRSARFEMVRLYRNNKDMRVRMAALSALSQVNDAWVADFLARSARFERDPEMARLSYFAAQAITERLN